MLIDKKYLEIREKVLSDAGIRNELVLLPHEIESSKALLRDYEAALAKLDRHLASLFVRTGRIEERLHTFHVAVAPHKRIPVELLSKIFAYCEPDPLYIDGQPVPPNTLYPWVLGQVCSLWRLISRHDSRLWRSITLKANAASERLCKILPTFVSKTLVIRDSGCSVTSAGKIIPQVSKLDIEMKAVEFKHLFDCLSADIFGNIETLYIYLRCSSRDQGMPIVLTEALSSMDKLRTLRLGCDESGIVPQALSLGFPCRQIVSLDISGVEGVDVVAISTYIQEFKSCESLRITLTDYDDGITIADTQLVMHTFRTLPRSLCSLVIKAHPYHEFFNSMHLVFQNILPEAWARLVFLDLMAADIEDGATIDQILRQCVQLASFRSTVPCAGSPIDVRVREIVLPHLTSLYFARIEDSWVFQRLRVPLLKDIVLENLPEETWNLDIATVHEMISSSGRSVQTWVETNGDRFAKKVNVVVVGSNDVV